MSLPAVDAASRRARLAWRHHLAAPAPDPETAAAAQVGLHSSDPATVHLSCWARVDGFAIGDLERALYDDRTMVRMLGMRRTLFVVPAGLAGEMHAACALRYEDQERRRLERMLGDQGVAGDPPAWVAAVERRTLAALEEAGTATAMELRETVPELTETLRFGEGTRWAGTVGLSTRILFLLATSGRIVRARPRGSWVSGQYRWAPVAAWLGAALPRLDPPAARRELVTRWLRSYGPGTLRDLKWWTGWTVGHTREALAGVGAVEVDLDGEAGWALPADLEPPSPPEPWVALLPGLDSTVMGWKDRDWYLGGHQGALFDRNGNAGPTVWSDGRVVGGWAQRPDGRVVWRALEDPGTAAAAAIDAAAERLTEWLAPVVVTPRFRAPLEKELAG